MWLRTNVVDVIYFLYKRSPFTVPNDIWTKIINKQDEIQYSRQGLIFPSK